MTQDSGAIIGRAGEIIQRFGGIRPMSSKTGIPVTTIQGWKQRDVIPANRRNELIEAANEHGINLGDLLLEIAGIQEERETKSAPANAALPNLPEAGTTRSINPDLRPANQQATWIAAGALILASVVAGALFAMAPKVTAVSGQDVRIKELEMQIEAMRQAQIQTPVASQDDLNQKITVLEGRVGQLSEQAKSYAATIEDLKSGTMAQRLSKIEGHVGTLLQQANAFGLQNLVQKIQGLQESEEGQGQLSGMMSVFASAAESSSPDALSETFANLRNSNPQVAETFKDVDPKDMKAAVMLLGMSQLRSSLARDNTSFEQDLKILKATMAKDDPELLAAIDRLAPKAKSGVLTPTGLSNQLRGLTGDIVSASLTGQDISIEDKAKARFGDIIKVEKDGQRLNGTSTQITIAEAQKKLDAGDVEGAVALLQQIQGPAAEKTQPVIDAAQATMLASQVQQRIGQNIIQTLKGLGGKSTPYINSGSTGVTQILDQVKSVGTAITGQGGQ